MAKAVEGCLKRPCCDSIVQRRASRYFGCMSLRAVVESHNAPHDIALIPATLAEVRWCGGAPRCGAAFTFDEMRSTNLPSIPENTDR